MRYADLTTDYFSKNVLPEFDNNQWALLIKDGESQIFRLPNDQLNPEKNYLKITTSAEIKDGRNLNMKLKMKANGIAGGSWREALNNKTTIDAQRDFLGENLASADFDHLELENFDFQNLQNIDKELIAELDLKSFHHLEKVSNFQILQIPILYPITTRTALFGDVRHNNLALGELFNITPSEQTIQLQIPYGFELLEIPKNIVLENEYGSYEMRFKRNAKGIEIYRKLIFKHHYVTSQDYPNFKKFYLQLLDSDRTKLAVRKRAVMVKE
jgi:hypothetical protein